MESVKIVIKENKPPTSEAKASDELGGLLQHITPEFIEGIVCDVLENIAADFAKIASSTIMNEIGYALASDLGVSDVDIHISGIKRAGDQLEVLNFDSDLMRKIMQIYRDKPRDPPKLEAVRSGLVEPEQICRDCAGCSLCKISGGRMFCGEDRYPCNLVKDEHCEHYKPRV